MYEKLICNIILHITNVYRKLPITVANNQSLGV
jgi:hypothetical protein